MMIAIFRIHVANMLFIPRSQMFNRKMIPFMIFFMMIAVSALTGCSPSLMMNQPTHASGSSLQLSTRSGSEILFYENNWHLTLSGIEGRAEICEHALPVYVKDTTISYFQVATVDNRGEDPWTQLLLTILGVIIVIGLAGVILYAAFRATER